MQLGITSQLDGLGPEDAKDLWFQADIDGDGVVNYEEFMVNFKPVMCLMPTFFKEVYL